MITKAKTLNLITNLGLAALVLGLSATVTLAQTKSPNSNKPVTTSFGTVSQVKGNNLIFEDTQTHKELTTTVNSSTKILGQLKKTTRVSDLKPNDMVVVISTESGSTASASAKTATQSAEPVALRIFVKESSNSAEAKRQAVYGAITLISGNIIKLTHPVQKDKTYTVVTSSSTVVKLKGTQDAKLTDLTEGQRIIVVGDSQADGTLLARYIHVIPGKAIGLTKSPAASSSASASANSKKNPTPTPKASSSSATPRANNP